jgi:hypothetical protein
MKCYSEFLLFPADAGLRRLAKIAAGSERPILPSKLSVAVRRILPRAWSADPIVRCSFEEIERGLEMIDLKITPGVDSALMTAYLSDLDDFEAQKCSIQRKTKSPQLVRNALFAEISLLALAVPFPDSVNATLLRQFWVRLPIFLLRRRVFSSIPIVLADFPSIPL